MVKLKIRPSEIQPSSTTLIFYLKADGFEFNVHTADEGVTDVAIDKMYDAIEKVANDKLTVRELLLSYFVSTAVEPFDHQEVKYPNVKVEIERPNVWLIVVYPPFRCTISCPWCYAQSFNLPSVTVEKAAGIRDVISKLVEQTVNAIKALPKDNARVTVVLGGWWEPALSPWFVYEFYKLLNNKIEQLGLGRLHAIYYAVSTSMPNYELIEVAEALNELYSFSLAVSLFDESLFLAHPVSKFMPYHAYLDFVEDCLWRLRRSRVSRFLFIILHENIRLPNNDIGLLVKLAGRVSFLRMHPVGDFRPPSRSYTWLVISDVLYQSGAVEVLFDACLVNDLILKPLEVSVRVNCDNIIRVTIDGVTRLLTCPRGGSCIVTS